jgi:hypothetical protein
MLSSMNFDRASSVIRHAEREIRGQIAEAAAAGAYEVVDRLSGIARRLAEMAEEAAPAPVTPDDHPPAKAHGADELPAAKPVARGNRKASRKQDYPRFERAGDTLVKIGWSKKGREEYVHKAPKTGVDAVTRRVMDVGKDGHVFVTDDLLPVKLNGGRDELPGYQAYVCLAWLRNIGAIQQHGREGYSVRGTNIADTVNKGWEALPVSRR